MRVIASDRQTGKTTTLIELAGEAEKRGEVNYIIVPNHQQAYRVAQKAKELGHNIGFPLTFEEFLNGRYAGQNIHHFYIDNVDMLIRYLTIVPIEAVTINVKKEEE